jgi:hypothetical protein
MSDGVNTPAPAAPEPSDKELNFRRLEAAREQEREARIRAEVQAQHMQQELENIKQMLQPADKDPLDDAEDYDPARLKAKFAREKANYQKEAENIARKTYEKLEAERNQKNYLQRLQSEHSDYNQVMNDANIIDLERNDPGFVNAVLKIPDEYERRKVTYERLKQQRANSPPRQSIQDKVAENAMNPYHIPAGSGAPAAVDYDLKSPASRQNAYEKLKAAQRRPIGGQARQG